MNTEVKDDMKEQLDKRDMVLRYFKQVDYNLKPSKEIYTRIKTKIIALSGINAKTEESYATLCKQAGLDLKEGRALISSLFNKELIHMIKKYDAILLNQQVEAYYIDKQYTYGAVVPDVAMITRDQAINYIIGLIEMNVKLRTFNNIENGVVNDAIKNITGASMREKDIVFNNFNSRNKQAIFQTLIDLNLKLKSLGNQCDVVKEFLTYCIDNTKRIDLLGNLLTDAVRKNPNVSQKFYSGSCEVNDAIYYLFPI